MRLVPFLLLLAMAVPAAARPPSGCRPRPAIDAHLVTAQAADRLRRMPGTTRGARADEFQLRDGRWLVQSEPGADAALYTSEQFKQRRQQLDEELRFRRVAPNEPFHLLRSLIDDGEGFAAHAAQLAAELRHRLASEGLAGGAEAADRLAARWREANCRADPSLFRELTAWAGELAVQRAGGRWTTRVGESGVVEPVVEVTIGRETRQLAPWLWVDQLLAGAVDLGRLLDDALALPTKPPAPPPTPVRSPPSAGIDQPPAADRPPRDAGAAHALEPPSEPFPLQDPGL